MKRLFVEELESRHLLSVSGLGHAFGQEFAPPRMEPPSFASFDRTDFDFGSRSQLENEPRFVTGGDVPAFGGSISMPGGATTVETFEIIVIVPQSVSISQTGNVPDGPLSSPLVSRGSPAAASLAAPASASILSAGLAPFSPQRSFNQALDQSAVAALEGAARANAASAATLSGISASRTASQLPVRADNLSASGSFRMESNSFIGAGTSSRPTNDSAGGIGGSNDRMPPPPSLPPAAAVEALHSSIAQAIRAGFAAMPQFADLMNGFANSNGNLGRIEEGITGFLASLEAGSGVAVAAGDRDLYPWILAGVVTAAACEMARRQWKKPALADGGNAAIPLAPWELPLDDENERTAR